MWHRARARPRPSWCCTASAANCKSQNVMQPTRVLGEIRLCHAALRHARAAARAMASSGPRHLSRGRVEDLQNALTFLATHPCVDPDRIAVHRLELRGARSRSMRAAWTNGSPPSSPMGDGAMGKRKFRGQHPTPQAWGALHRHAWRKGAPTGPRTGKSLMVVALRHRSDPANTCATISPANRWRCSPPATSRCFRPRPRRACSISAPRTWLPASRRGPLLLIHSASDSVTPTEQSIEMFKTRRPAERAAPVQRSLDHFLFAENSARVWGVMRDWLDKLLPGLVARTERSVMRDRRSRRQP